MPALRPEPASFAAWCALGLVLHVLGGKAAQRLVGDLYPLALAGYAAIGLLVSLRRLPPPAPPPQPPPPPSPPPPPPLSRFTSRPPWVAPSVWTRRPTDDEYDLTVSLWVVAPALRAAGPFLQRAASDPRLDPSDPAHAQALLDHTPLVGTWWTGGRWPHCCDRLTVLVGAPPRTQELAVWEGLVGRLDESLTGEPAPSPEARRAWSAELALIRAGGMPTQGVNLFTCSACGRVYGVATHA